MEGQISVQWRGCVISPSNLSGKALLLVMVLQAPPSQLHLLQRLPDWLLQVLCQQAQVVYPQPQQLEATLQ